MNKTQIEIFDSTMRDGAQGEGISFSVEDKIKIVKSLDALGISYIEAGNPGSNQKDLEFFVEVKNLKLKYAKLTAFGSTRRKNIPVEEDNNVQSLLIADTPVITIFGKSWDFHVTDIIKTTLEENLKMIEETIHFFKEKGKKVIFDAEHFFDGYRANHDYALKSLKAAVTGGADCLVLCDTNGGSLPFEIYEITRKVIETFPIKVGIHCHNDSGMAVANSIMAVEAGAGHVQGTYLGFGERTGNANLSVIIPNLQLKKGFSCIPEDSMQNLTSTAKFIAETANLSIGNNEPYIGKSAFAHKGGMHIDGVSKATHSFEHINPESVGNERRFLMSEVSGRSTILSKIQEIKPDITKDSPETHEIIKLLKQMEYDGYQFEGAEASFELLIHKKLGTYKPFFELDHYRIIDEDSLPDKESNSSAIIKIIVDNKSEITAAEGNGPVNALDKALRRALETFYPDLKKVELTDFKVRVLHTKSATASKVRVLIESTDKYNTWTTVGVSADVIKASWIALVDSLEYKLMKDTEAGNKNGENIKDIVKKRYAQVAKEEKCCCSTLGSFVNDADKISKSIGYSEEELKNVPEANLGLGCGNPGALGEIKKGDIVLDLGSGAGLDCFLAAKKVGCCGKVIGVDMTEEMIKKARTNAINHNYTNVEFRLGEIENLPVEDDSVDIIISNCVINLVPDKLRAFQEAYRVLKPGGKAFISDMVLLDSLTDKDKNNEDLLCSCVAGALLKDTYIDTLAKAGFSIEIIAEDRDLSKKQYHNMPVASLKFKATKPK